MLELYVEKIAMSTRVALPMFLGCRMSELRRQVPSPTPAQERTAQVRKNLFGPIDHDENIKFVQEELNKISQADCKRWNFDFQAEKPKEGRYSWERVGEAVPQAYDMPRLRCLTTTSPATTSSATKTLATPTPLRIVPEGGGTSPSTSVVDQPSTSSPTTTATTTTTTPTPATTTTPTPASTTTPTPASTTTPTPTTTTTPTPTTTTTPTPATTTTTTVLAKPTSRRAESRLPTTISSSSEASSSEGSTSRRSISEVVVVKKWSGGVRLAPEHTSLPTVRRTRARTAQLPVTDFMKIRKSKRAAPTKLEEEHPPALVKRPKTTPS